MANHRQEIARSREGPRRDTTRPLPTISTHTSVLLSGFLPVHTGFGHRFVRLELLALAGFAAGSFISSLYERGDGPSRSPPGRARNAPRLTSTVSVVALTALDCDRRSPAVFAKRYHSDPRSPSVGSPCQAQYTAMA